VKKAGHKNIILQIIFNFVSKYYFIKDIKLAMHNKNEDAWGNANISPCILILDNRWR